MNKILVLYRSQTGFTQKYAQWIAKELSCDILRAKQISANTLLPYDVIIYGGGFYGGQIKGLKKVKSLISSSGKKRLIVFATGATPPESEEIIRSAFDHTFTEQERKTIPAFYFHSGLNYKKMNWTNQCMMKIFCKMMAKKKNKTEQEIAMAEGIKHSFDCSKKDYILPLISYVRQL